jgi:hypothetical protein
MWHYSPAITIGWQTKVSYWPLLLPLGKLQIASTYAEIQYLGYPSLDFKPDAEHSQTIAESLATLDEILEIAG